MPLAQMPGGPPPAVGVVRAQMQPITETSEFVGRIQAIDRVALVARVTAFLEQRLFTEGAEVNKGDLLYVLEQPPFQADLAAKQATVQQLQANLTNATIAYNRAASLLHTPAGQQSIVDDARATMLADAALVQNARGAGATSRRSTWTTPQIRAPISGKIGRTSVTIGNVVSPGSGVLATIVSQDPMYVVFPIAVRTALELRQHYADKGGFNAVRDQDPPARRPHVRPDRQAEFRRQHSVRQHRHDHPARHHSQSAAQRRQGRRLDRRASW